MTLSLNAYIESILFYSAQAVSIDLLRTVLEVSKNDVEQALEQLESKLSGRGLVLIRQGNDVMLGTHPDATDILDTLWKKEVSTSLTKASLETLSIILYEGPIRKAEIDHIRGVNSSAILRNLRSRGLIEKKEQDGTLVYSATIETLAHLGIQSLEELPEYSSVKESLHSSLEEENPLTREG